MESPNPATDVTVAQAIEHTLWTHGVKDLMMVPGGPLMPFLEAVYQYDRIKPHLATHEVGATLMAEGYYRASRRMAATAVTAGPGLTNTSTAVALAHRELTPLFLISAQVSSRHYGRGAAQELDTVRLLEPITKASVALHNPDRAVEVTSELLRLATQHRSGPVHLSVPSDVFRQRFAGRLPQAPPRLPRQCDPSGVSALATRLLQAKNPVWIAGKGTVDANASAQLLRLSERCPKLRFAATPRAKGVVPESWARYLGVYGFSGDEAAERYVHDKADLIIVSGSRLGEITSAGWSLMTVKAPVVQLDLEATELGRMLPVEIALVGDIERLLDHLNDELGPSEATQSAPSAGLERLTPTPPPQVRLDRRPARGLAPEAVLQALDSCRPRRAHVYCDIGNSMSWCIRKLKFEHPGHWHVNLTFGAMGHALPAAIGGRIADVGPVVSVLGDAAFLMSGAELHSAVEHSVPLLVVVMNNRGHGMVETGRRRLFATSRVPSMMFQRGVDAAAFARALGARGLTVSTLAEFREGCQHLKAATGPLVLDVCIDRDAEPHMGKRLDTLASDYDRKPHCAKGATT